MLQFYVVADAAVMISAAVVITIATVLITVVLGGLFFAFVYNWMIEYVWPLSITQDILQKKISKKSLIADIRYGWLFSKKLISELSKNMATLCHLLYKQ